jgi:hypothetical protein
MSREFPVASQSRSPNNSEIERVVSTMMRDLAYKHSIFNEQSFLK